MVSLGAGEEVTVAGCLCWLGTRCWRVLRVVSLCLGLQSPVVISANCNYLLPAVQVETNRLFPEKLLFVFPARVPGRKSALPGKGNWHRSAWGGLSVVTSGWLSFNCPQSFEAQQELGIKCCGMWRARGWESDWSLVLGDQALSLPITLSSFCSTASVCIQHWEGSLCTTEMLTGRILFQKIPWH